MLRKTGLSIAEHQTRTLTSYEELLQLAPDLPSVSLRSISEAMLCGGSPSSPSGSRGGARSGKGTSDNASSDSAERW